MVNKLLKNGKNLFLSRQSSILGAASVLMATVAISRVLGLVRSRLLAQYFTPEEAAVYFAAFRLPDLVYNLLIFGALSVAFIPVFSRLVETEGRQKAFHFAEGLLTLGLLLFGLASLLAIIFAPTISLVIAPGFNENQREEMISLSRLLFGAQFLFVIGGLLTSVLQTFKHFLIPALSGILYNVGIIIGIVVLTPYLGINGVVVGVLIGAALYVLIQLPLAYKVGFRFKWSSDFSQPGVREVWKLMLPRTIAIAGDQLRTTFNLSLASIISVGSVTMLTLAQQLYLVPVGLFVATMAQAVLPVLSKLEAKGDKQSFVKTLVTSLHQVIFLILPAAVILIVLRIPVVRLAFGADQFTWEATVLTGKTVAMLAIGLAAEAVIVMLMRAYYALHDTATPVKIALIGLLIDVLASVIGVFVFGLDVWVLGLSSTIGGIFSAIVMFVLINQRVGGLWSREFFSPFFRMLVAAFVMAVSLYIPIKLLDQVVFDTTRTINLLVLTGIAGSCGMIMYLILTRLLQVKEALMVLTYVNDKIRGKPVKDDEVKLSETVKVTETSEETT
jgi:putative peptidoglycan lipid II flippase